MAPKLIRGTLVFLNELALTIGILLAYFVDYVFTSVPGGWRWMLGLALIPALVLGIGMQRMPDSPRWLMTGAFWLYAVLTLASVIFTIKLVPETKNRTLEQIQEEMHGTRQRLA